jgi:hypothetical protein
MLLLLLLLVRSQVLALGATGTTQHTTAGACSHKTLSTVWTPLMLPMKVAILALIPGEVAC